jgi:hypothetical protein
MIFEYHDQIPVHNSPILKITAPPIEITDIDSLKAAEPFS